MSLRARRFLPLRPINPSPLNGRFILAKKQSEWRSEGSVGATADSQRGSTGDLFSPARSNPTVQPSNAKSRLLGSEQRTPFLDRLIDLSTRPVPLRTLILRRILQKVPIGSYRARLHAGAVDRPWYGWCLYHAAVEARALGYSALTTIEFGVAGGSGLLCLCRHRDEIEREIGIETSSRL
jgi:hypothetical protein